jgi:restriction system-associated AAA family ATPase
MKLIRLKITDPKGFRSLQRGFEYHFRKEWQLQDKASATFAFAPFVCAGPNGSGKSNLLELLAAIFYHLECMVLDKLPESFSYDEQENPLGFNSRHATPDGFELDYWIKPKGLDLSSYAKVSIVKEPNQPPQIIWHNRDDFYRDHNPLSKEEKRSLLPEYILAYSSGENEILSLPFFKMRFIQYDEYWLALKGQLPYAGKPESRLVYLDNSFSQAILLCNLLFQNHNTLAPFRQEVGIESLKQFRIILKRSISVPAEVANAFGEKNPCLTVDSEANEYSVNLLKLLEADEALKEEIRREGSSHITSYENFEPSITRLKHCATCWFEDEATDSLYLDYSVNQATRDAFGKNFDSALALFQSLQVLLTLNLYSVSDQLKADLYQSDSLYVSETVPSLASDERVMRIKNFWVTRQNTPKPVLMKSLSDGEHQLLHTLGLCLLFKNTNSLFLLDEPETHFNPQWRANFITRLRQGLDGDNNQEMLITTHTPFLISDSRPENVLVFNKDDNGVSVSTPDYNTLGASINKITMATFDKRETIGGLAYSLLTGFKERAAQVTDFKKRAAQEEKKQELINEINHTLVDSVEKVLLIKAILDSMEESH